MSIFKSISIKVVSFLEKDKFIILGVCLLIIIYYSLTRYFLSTDHLFQFGTVINFLNGDGFSIKYFDGEFIYYLKREQWPYFLRILSIPFLFVTRNIETSAICIRILSFVLLFGILKLFYKDLFMGNKDQNKATNITLLFAAFCVVPFNYGNDIDLLSAGGLILSLSLLVRYYKYKSNKLFLYLFFIIIGLVSHMRYDYIPKICLFLIIILSYEIINKKIKQNIFHKIFLSFLTIVNLYWITSQDFFTKEASSTISGYSAVKSLESYWHLLYSPAVNSFFPDHVLYSFLSKISNNLISQHYLIFVIIMVFLSFLIIIKLFFVLKQKKNFLINYLGLFCLINLAVLFVIYKFGTVYSQEQIQNSSLISYSGLTVVNRYLLLFHVSAFILAIYASLKAKSLFFQTTLIFSLLFGLFHSIYLSTKYSYKRSENLKLISVNEYRYLDCVKTSDIVIKEIKNKSNVLFIPVFELDSMEYRKRSPSPIIQANGGTIFKRFPGENFLLEKSKFRLDDFDKIYYCDLSTNFHKYKENFIHIYKGNFFSLFEKL